MAQQVKWGLVGCGDIARKRVAPALRDLASCRLVAVNRAQAELAAEFAQEFGAPRWYADWRELLAAPELDAVYLATPVNLHAPQTIAAAEAGKHILCEKPMALTVAECDEMLAACQANGVKLGIAYYRHFYPVIGRIKELLQTGAIGRPVLAQINAFEFFNPAADQPRHWLLRKEESGGGPMFDFGCHRIEVLLDLFGPIKAVRGLAGRVLFAREVEDTSTAIFEFASGPQAVLSVTHAAFEPQDTVSIFGSAGSLHVPVLNQGQLTIITAAGERREEHPPHANIHWPLIEDFAQAVLADRAPVVTGAIGRAVAQIEAAIYA